MKETSVNDLPWHLGLENLFLRNFAVQEKQHPDPWCLHINNTSATIMVNKSHLSQRFEYKGSFYFHLPVLHTGRTQGSREVEVFALDHNASY